MIDTQGELIRLLEYLAKNMPCPGFQVVYISGAVQVITYSVN